MVREQPAAGFWQQFSTSMLLWPNRITLLRILTIPLLFWLAIADYRNAFAIAFALMATTDWADGIVARWLKQESAFGARFDSIADMAFYLSTLFWVYLLEPTILTDHSLLIMSAGTLIIASQLFAYLRYGHFIEFHTWLTKAAAFLSYAFVLITILWKFNSIFFAILAVVILLATLENILLTAFLRKVKQNVGSIVFILFGRKR